MAPNVCGNCSKPGHNIRTCPLLKSVSDSVQTQKRKYTCFTCGEIGHSSTTCTFVIETCSKCSQNGHSTSECTVFDGTSNYSTINVDREDTPTSVIGSISKSSTECFDMESTLDDITSDEKQETIFEADFEVELDNSEQLSNDTNLNVFIEKTKWCDICQRTSTSFYPLVFEDIDRRQFSRMRKTFWKLPSRPSLNLCQFCVTFSNKGSDNGRENWNCSWPAVLWSVFSNNTNFNALGELLKLIPFEIRFSYLVRSSLLTDETKYMFDNVQPECRDWTAILNHFNETMEPDKLVAPQFCQTIRQTAFPSVLCPMNCCVFPEFKSRLIPLNHYIRFMQSTRLEQLTSSSENKLRSTKETRLE
jgi:hypothetical protein